MGTSASCQVIIPFKTSCYNDIQEIPEFSIPMCTLRNFPSKIEHCIEWGLNKFNIFFTSPVEDLKKFFENKNEFFNIIQNEETTDVMIKKMKQIKKLLEIINGNNFDKIIQNAVEIFYEEFNFQIQKLIDEFPPDHINEDGSLLWSRSKRFPNIIDFNINNQDYFNFIKYYSLILARSIKVKINDDEYIKKTAQTIKISKNISNINNLSREKELKEINSLKNFLNDFDIKKIDIKGIIPEKFQKDNDKNKHVFFIKLCTNLRAKNYRIPLSNEQKNKNDSWKNSSGNSKY